MSKSKACDFLRSNLIHRLKAWDAVNLAERILGTEIDSQSDSVEYLLSGLDDASDVDSLSDEEILKAFEVEA